MPRDVAKARPSSSLPSALSRRSSQQFSHNFPSVNSSTVQFAQTVPATSPDARLNDVISGGRSSRLPPSRSSIPPHLIFAILLLLGNWKKFDGQILYLYFILYSVSRFFIEFLRADNPQILLGLTISQVICVVLFVIGVVMYIRGFFSSWRKG